MKGYGLKFRAKVRLDTQTEIAEFVNRVGSVSVPVFLTSGAYCVSGKSLLGAIYTLEWDELWCECEHDIYHLIEDFIIVEQSTTTYGRVANRQMHQSVKLALVSSTMGSAPISPTIYYTCFCSSVGRALD